MSGRESCLRKKHAYERVVPVRELGLEMSMPARDAC